MASVRKHARAILEKLKQEDKRPDKHRMTAKEAKRLTSDPTFRWGLSPLEIIEAGILKVIAEAKDDE
jgi:hypothetical protein